MTRGAISPAREQRRQRQDDARRVAPRHGDQLRRRRSRRGAAPAARTPRARASCGAGCVTLYAASYSSTRFSRKSALTSITGTPASISGTAARPPRRAAAPRTRTSRPAVSSASVIGRSMANRCGKTSPAGACPAALRPVTPRQPHVRMHRAAAAPARRPRSPYRLRHARRSHRRRGVRVPSGRWRGGRDRLGRRRSCPPRARPRAAICVAALRFVRDRGIPYAFLNTEDFRVPAVRLYLDLGFEPEMVDPAHPAWWAAFRATYPRPLP